GDDAHASFLPQAFGHAFAVAEFGNIEPEKKSAGRAHVTVSVADDLVGQIELRRIELAVFHDVRLIAVSRNGDVLERDWNLRRRDVAQFEESREEAPVAGDETDAQARQVRPFRQRVEYDDVGEIGAR